MGTTKYTEHAKRFSNPVLLSGRRIDVVERGATSGGRGFIALLRMTSFLDNDV
jgi:hypothetical protein